MNQTIAALLPYLQFLAGSGSGWLASWLFDELRDDWLQRPYWPRWAASWLDTAFYKPLGARATVFVLTALIAVLASIIVALLTGQPLISAADTAIAPLIAIVLGQVRHGVKTFPTIGVTLEGDSDNEAGTDREHQ